jgi:hypothetical protein
MERSGCVRTDECRGRRRQGNDEESRRRGSPILRIEGAPDQRNGAVRQLLLKYVFLFRRSVRRRHLRVIDARPRQVDVKRQARHRCQESDRCFTHAPRRRAHRTRFRQQVRRGMALADRHPVKSSLRIVVLAWVAFGVMAGCGGVTLQPSDGGSAGGHSGGGGSSGGQPGSAGTRDAGGAQCTNLDEYTCKTRTDCTAQYCGVCPNSTFNGCTPLGAPPVDCPGPVDACVQSCDLLDEALCKARSDCQSYYCEDCGIQQFVGCGEPGGGTACPARTCGPPCSGLDETSCKARSDCRVAGCPACDGGTSFICQATTDPPIECPAACPAPSSCSTVTTEAACNARTDCHSVYVDPGNTCGCEFDGCCTHFSRCTDGAKASCTGTPSCQIVTPYCGAPGPAPAYVVSYTASCFEGCVRPSECGP